MINHMTKPARGLLILPLTLLLNVSHADTRTITQTKNQLKQIEQKMSSIQRQISHAHDKQSILNKELAYTEKQILDGALQLKKIKLAIASKQQQITRLENQIRELETQLQAQQTLLAKHARSRYKMGEYQPIKWLLNQDKPDAIDRLLTYQQYLVHSRLQAMDEVTRLQQSLTANQTMLQQELAAQEQLRQQLNKRQQAFDRDKRHHQALMGSLSRDIQNGQQTLQTYKRNRDNLSNLIANLSQKSMLQSRLSFSRMHGKLNNPVITNRSGLKKINQGVVFFADEGSLVFAVSPGKVVFSDRLNGYGLLLIIDHGWGYMTLYANNQSLLKHKGDIVNQKEKIATVGHSGTFKENGLYFEIRQRGKAVNPLQWMS